ncbi:MAG: glycosyltransferase [Pseudomonadota bacterium]
MSPRDELTLFQPDGPGERAGVRRSEPGLSSDHTQRIVTALLRQGLMTAGAHMRLTSKLQSTVLRRRLAGSAQHHRIVTVAAAGAQGAARAALNEPTSLAAAASIQSMVQDEIRAPWARLAAETLPFEDSARAPLADWQLFLNFTLLSALAGGLVFAPVVLLSVTIVAVTSLIAVTAALRIAVLWKALQRRRRTETPLLNTALAERPTPAMTLLIPLYRETEVLKGLLAALEALDYPRSRVEALLLVEEDDHDMQAALRRLRFAGWIKTIVVPDGAPRTKPRALNAALPLASGDIIGIYDAEDRPARDQLRKVADAFDRSGDETACLQCRLMWRNARENFLSRCFSIEYAIWFDFMLAGLRDIRLPLPLGGASVFFRADALREVGGWDAHNVTEDADLGIRLARRGYRTDLVDSTTLEEAVTKPWPWIRQRSRWIKGYMQTWMTHMRAPLRCWRDLGTRGFVGLQVLFPFSILSFLAQPLFFFLIGWWIATGELLWLEQTPLWMIAPIAATLTIGQIAILATAVIALRRRGLRWLAPWVLAMPFYWPLGAIAAYKALWELIVRPFYWDKTEHGVTHFEDASPGRPPPDRADPATLH